MLLLVVLQGSRSIVCCLWCFCAKHHTARKELRLVNDPVYSGIISCTWYIPDTEMCHTRTLCILLSTCFDVYARHMIQQYQVPGLASAAPCTLCMSSNSRCQQLPYERCIPGIHLFEYQGGHARMVCKRRGDGP